MKLNLVKVLNEIEMEMASVVEETNLHPLEGKTDLDWYDKYQLERWKKEQEEKKRAIAPWSSRINKDELDDYYYQWYSEVGMYEYWNEISAKECDRLMWEGKDYSHVYFHTIPTFDEYMEEEMNTIAKYLVVAA